MGSAGSDPAPADFQFAASTKLAYFPAYGKVRTRTQILLSLFYGARTAFPIKLPSHMGPAPHSSNIYRGLHSTMEFFAVTRAAMDFTALLLTNAVHMAISGHPLAYARPGSV